MTDLDIKKDILIVAHYTNFPGETGNSRFTDIINGIDKDKNNIELITSSFYHIKKRTKVI